ncbi:MAG: TolC family protein [Acidobacteria bacterium]|nr:TolC family protein [Acidobacteriota bacterium]
MERKNYFRFLAALTLLISTESIALAQSASMPSGPEHAVASIAQTSAYVRLIDPANGVTADDLVRYALEHNGELAAARKMIDEARGRLRQAGLKPNPMLEASGTQAVTSPDNNLMIGIELPLEPGGRRRARVTVAERELEMKEEEVRDFERRLAGEVRMKYADAIAAARNLKFTEEMLNLIRNSHQLIRARVDLGKSAPLEQNLVWVELNKADAMRIGFESKAEVAVFELKKVIGMPPDEPLRLRGEFGLERQPPPHSEALRLALESRPDLKMLRAAESLAAAQAEQARIEGKVDASIFANYQRMNFGYDIRGFNDAGALVPITGVFHYATFGVRLTLPVRNKNQGLIEAATAAEEAARKRREFAELVVRNEVAAVYMRLDRAQMALAIYRDRVRDSAMRNVDVLRQAYVLGQRAVLDYIAEQRRFIEIETGYTDLLKEHFDALIEIERVTGLSSTPAEQKIKTEN